MHRSERLPLGAAQAYVFASDADGDPLSCSYSGLEAATLRDEGETVTLTSPS